MRSRRLKWGTGIPLAALAGLHVWMIAIRSADPRWYFDTADDPGIALWRYPALPVVASCVLLVMEAAIFWGVLFSTGAPPSWQRAMLGVLEAGFAVFGGVLIVGVHSPAYVKIHFAWTGELMVIALATLGIVGIGALVSRVRKKR